MSVDLLTAVRHQDHCVQTQLLGVKRSEEVVAAGCHLFCHFTIVDWQMFFPRALSYPDQVLTTFPHAWFFSMSNIFNTLSGADMCEQLVWASHPVLALRFGFVAYMQVMKSISMLGH